MAWSLCRLTSFSSLATSLSLVRQGYALFRDQVEYMDTDVFFKVVVGNPIRTQLDMDLMPDGLHPSSQGYRLWGSELQIKLREMLEAAI